MENIKKNFTRDYNAAIDSYNNGDYTLFFRNIRPAIEAFCKLVIYDLVDKQLAKDLLDGRQKFHYDYKNCSVSFDANPSNRPVESSMLASLAQQTIYFKKGETLASYLNNRTINRRKSAIDSDFIKLASDFKIASEVGSHEGDSSIDIENEARNLSTFMPKVFSDLKDILSNEIITFFASLNKPLSNISFQNPRSKYVLSANNDFLVFDEITNKMEENPGVII